MDRHRVKRGILLHDFLFQLLIIVVRNMKDAYLFDFQIFLRQCSKG